jgi:hypothetical protein
MGSPKMTIFIKLSILVSNMVALGMKKVNLFKTGSSIMTPSYVHYSKKVDKIIY